MQRIKNDPKSYLRRSDLGWNASEVAANRFTKTRSKRDFFKAAIEPSFYASFARKPKKTIKKS
jgi:hypothetical protein